MDERRNTKAQSEGSARVPRLSQKALEGTNRSTGFVPVTESLEQKKGSYVKNRQETKKKKSGGAATIVFRISAVVFCACLIALGFIGFNYWQGQQKYEKVSEEYFSVQDVEALSLGEVTINWDSLLAINPETVAWVYIPGTVVNYPIVHTTDNDKYIKTDYEGATNWAVSYGAIFLDCNCEADMSCQNNFFYGHNMNNGVMFHVLETFADNGVFNENRTVYIYTPQGNYRLTTFALVHVSAYDDLIQPNTGSAQNQAEYVQTQMNRSVVTPAGNVPAASEIGKTFVLLTCDNLASNGRYGLYCYVAESSVKGVTGLEQSALVAANDAQAVTDGVDETVGGEDEDAEG